MEFLTYSLIIVLVVSVVYAAALVSYHTIRSDYFEKKQKIMIIVIAWLVPIIGPAFILTVLNEDKTTVRKSGIPLIDFVFLSGVFTQKESSNHASVESSGSDIPGYEGDSGST